MKILMINKYLYPRGGAETYVFRLGACLQERGHGVEYFGMEHENRIAGNRANAYVRSINYHSGSLPETLRSGFTAVYSGEACEKLRLVLEDFQPDVCHLNNFHYQLTPAILLEICKWRRKTGKPCRIVYTAHDSQLVCPNHLMRNTRTGENCTACLGGHYVPCLKGKCIHGSGIKSAVGAFAGWFWDRAGVYRQLDAVIAPSRFLARKLSENTVIKDKLVVLPNFVDCPKKTPGEKEGGYVLYFGRYSREKGIETLLKAVDSLPQIPFVFAGDGPLSAEIEKRKNIENKGFLSGEELAEVIRKARFAVIPSECFENCPFSVMESQVCGTPVLGADIGGIPELIRDGETGELFESGNAAQLIQKIRRLWQDPKPTAAYAVNCEKAVFPNLSEYCEKLECYYLGER